MNKPAPRRVIQSACVFFAVMAANSCMLTNPKIKVVGLDGTPIQGVNERTGVIISIGPEPMSGRSGNIRLQQIPTILQKAGYFPVIVRESDLDDGVIVMRKLPYPMSFKEKADYRIQMLREMEIVKNRGNQ